MWLIEAVTQEAGTVRPLLRTGFLLSRTIHVYISSEGLPMCHV
jgi:hypothetical protein